MSQLIQLTLFSKSWSNDLLKIQKEKQEWLNQASKTIGTCTSIENVRRGEAWTAINDEAERLTLVISTLGRECREWAPGAAHAEV